MIETTHGDEQQCDDCGGEGVEEGIDEINGDGKKEKAVLWGIQVNNCDIVILQIGNTQLTKTMADGGSQVSHSLIESLQINKRGGWKELELKTICFHSQLNIAIDIYI